LKAEGRSEVGIAATLFGRKTTVKEESRVYDASSRVRCFSTRQLFEVRVRPV